MTPQRKKAKLVNDYYYDEIDVEPLGHAPAKREKDEIRRVLKMGTHQKFPHCRNRDMKKARKLDLALGITIEQQKMNLGVHTKARHVCADCRCSNVAGLHTRGWWHWPESNPKGLPEVGHYGVGPCYHHGPHNMESFNGNSLKQYRETVVTEMEAMQQTGSAPDTTGAYVVRMQEDAKNGEIRNDIRTSLEMTKGMVTEIIAKLGDVDDGEERKSQFVKDLHEIYETRGEQDPDDFNEAVWNHVQTKTPLTESAKGSAMPMTSNTAYKLQLSFIKEVANIAKSDFDVSKGDYAHKDTVNSMIVKFMMAVNMVYKAKGDPDDWKRLGCEITDILRAMDAADGSPLMGGGPL